MVHDFMKHVFSLVFPAFGSVNEKVQSAHTQPSHMLEIVERRLEVLNARIEAEATKAQQLKKKGNKLGAHMYHRCPA